ncbi:MAG: dipeptide epimerase [Propionibacteriaceae bacterium]|jgi:L-alanine-DL-glutamate epimerase-like enolase superfamily enzyme|nr:dipeptide epimerase [Propionibacteriaceae bacterium]
MRITAVRAAAISVPLAEPFVISLAVIDSAETVIVTLETDEGLAGYGEGAGIAMVTGETTATVLAAIRTLTPALIGQDPFAIEAHHRAFDRLLSANGAAKAALDLALYDLMGKAVGLPVYRLLGGHRTTVETDMTIGLGAPDAMAAQASDLVAQGYREIKVKAGSNRAQDRAAIALIRAVAPHAHLKVDANQGWTVAEALDMARYYTGFDVGAIEQPVPHWDLDGLVAVRQRSPIPIMADESCFTAHDASTIIKRGAADLINIKLMKCGGLYPALQINAVAEAAGVRCMVGCMLESRLGIAAGAHLVAARPNIVYADLDSFHDFDDSSVIESAFGFDTPVIRLTDALGLGVTIAGDGAR